MVFSNKEIKYRYQKIFNGNEKLRIGVAVALINLENQVLLEKEVIVAGGVLRAAV